METHYQIYYKEDNIFKWLEPHWCAKHHTKNQTNYLTSKLKLEGIEYKVFIYKTESYEVEFPESDYILTEEYPDIPKILREP